MNDKQNEIELVEQIEELDLKMQKVREEHLSSVANQVAKLEEELQVRKLIEEQYKQLKDQLFDLMNEYGVKSWKTDSGISLSRIDTTEDKIVTTSKFNETMFENDFPDLYNQYLYESTEIKKGKKGYVRITLPKVVDFSKLSGGNE